MTLTMTAQHVRLKLLHHHITQHLRRDRHAEAARLLLRLLLRLPADHTARPGLLAALSFTATRLGAHAYAVAVAREAARLAPDAPVISARLRDALRCVRRVDADVTEGRTP